MAQCEEWIADIQQYSSDKRVGRTMSHHAAALKRHTAQLREELQKLPCPEGLDPDADDPAEKCSAMTSAEDTLLHEQVKPSSSKDLPNKIEGLFKAKSQIISQHYSMAPAEVEQFKPMTDVPVADLTSNTVISADSSRFPRDPCYKRINLALCKNLEVSLATLQASSVGSLFARTICLWASDLSSSDKDILEELKDNIKKIALTIAFTADASLDAV
ncbi:UNVERIFIED_CONTAM: hypothetical protein K2H54_057374 [Gekko kuhli]